MRHTAWRSLMAILVVAGGALAAAPTSSASSHHHLRNLHHNAKAGRHLFAQPGGQAELSDEILFIGSLRVNPALNNQSHFNVTSFECGVTSDGESQVPCTLGATGKVDNSTQQGIGHLEVRSADGQVNSTENFDLGNGTSTGSGTESQDTDKLVTQVTTESFFQIIGRIDANTYLIEADIQVFELPNKRDKDS